METTDYYRLGFMPSFSAFYNYSHVFENSDLSQLFGASYPFSYIGLQMSIPLFQGFRRIENIRKSRLTETSLDLQKKILKAQIYTEYRFALAAYKSNYYNLQNNRDNVQMAKEVYGIVKLQYMQGIKAYLDVINAETDLRTSEINYLNALFQVLSNKIDIEKAIGNDYSKF